MNKVILSLSASVMVLGVMIAPSATFAQYGGGGGFITPVVVPTSHSGGHSGSVVTIAPAGKVLGASTFQFTSNLRKGMSSDAVKQLQERLRAEGFFTYATSTGYFGPITFAAVQAYQTAHKLPSTGFVGPLTIAELNK